MERINFQEIEKWQTKFESKKLYSDKNSKNFIVLKCSLIHQENTYGTRKKLYNWRCNSQI